MAQSKLSKAQAKDLERLGVVLKAAFEGKRKKDRINQTTVAIGAFGSETDAARVSRLLNGTGQSYPEPETVRRIAEYLEVPWHTIPEGLRWWRVPGFRGSPFDPVKSIATITLSSHPPLM